MQTSVAAGVPIAGIFDLPITWAHTRKLWNEKTRSGWFPDLMQLVQTGLKPVEECGFSVVLSPSQEDIYDIRQFLRENHSRQCTMFGRFGFKQHEFEIDRELHGLVFKFKTPEEAFCFSLRFSDLQG